jgi:uncharacterized protein YkwD
LAGRPATTFESLGKLLSSHRAVTRVSLAALSFTIIVALGQQAAPVIQAGPEQAPLVPESLLPQSVGVGVPSGDVVTIAFDSPMDPATIDAALQVLPAHNVELRWNADRTELSIAPEHLWRTDERYLVVVPSTARAADGTALDGVQRYVFSTQPAPAVADFQVRLAPSGTDDDARATEAALATDASSDESAQAEQPATHTATDVSASSAITISFSTSMDAADVDEHFSIAPEVDGDLSWSDGDLVFTPTDRLEPGVRYTISVIGAHDRVGNVIGGEANFSFIVQDGAQLTKTDPKSDATDVEPATVEMWFSQPMDVDATNEAFSLTDLSTGALVGGLLNWNEAGTQLIYTPDAPFSGGRAFEVVLAKGATDADGNAVTASWTFETKAAPVMPSTRSATTRSAPAPVVPPAAPATSLAGYALNQVNAARAAYGFGPVVLDASISAVASAHAMDQATNGYFSHNGLNGSTRESRLRAGGVSFGWSGENQCYHVGMSQQSTLDWCHAQFMAEPYPGHWNHIANILNPSARRMGIGIATVGGRTVITWNFTD